MKTRIAKFIADSGIASRREAEKLIADGKVFVNGEKILTPVFFVSENDSVRVGADIIRPDPTQDLLSGEAASKSIPPRRYGAGKGECNSPLQTRVFAFNKPINTITSRSDPQGRETIYNVLEKSKKAISYQLSAISSLKYIGRLDYKTTGLLLLTNDGELARKLTLPETRIKRVYEAKLHPKSLAEIKNPKIAKNLRSFLSPTFPDEAIFDSARAGITIAQIKYAPIEIEVLSRYPLTVRLTLTEGKKNEIRIVFDYIGLPVKKLHRISYAGIELGNLKPGEVREIKNFKIAN